MDFEQILVALRDPSVVLGLIAGMTQLFGYVVYVRRASDSINTGSWSIWAIGGVIDLVSYFALTHDEVLAFLPAVCAAAAVSVYVWARLKKRLSKMDTTDRWFLGLDIGITVLWVGTELTGLGSFVPLTLVANILYQLTTLGSYVPMLRGMLKAKDPEKEDPLPWIVWTCSYTMLTLAVCLRYQQWGDFLFPVSHVVLQAAVAAVALHKLRSSR